MHHETNNKQSACIYHAEDAKGCDLSDNQVAPYENPLEYPVNQVCPSTDDQKNRYKGMDTKYHDREYCSYLIMFTKRRHKKNKFLQQNNK